VNSLDFFDTVENRRSVRAYLSKEIEEDKLKRILTALLRAPSAGNLQAYCVFVVKNQKIRENLARAAFGQHFIAEAPISLVFCALPDKSSAKYGKRGAELYCIQDATIAASYAQLAATAVGLATCWVGAFDDDAVKKILSLKKEKPVAILTLGYAAEIPEKTEREPIDSIIKKI